MQYAKLLQQRFLEVLGKSHLQQAPVLGMQGHEGHVNVSSTCDRDQTNTLFNLEQQMKHDDYSTWVLSFQIMLVVGEDHCNKTR